MTAEQRLVRALRDALTAYEEIVAGKVRKPRRRGPIGPVGVDATPEERAAVAAVVDKSLARAGVRRLA